ncbi:molybdopterin-dependent oxidoreductase [Actinoallomurus acaciae]|uniref:Molybdopterin-dependent oxidoreductase n=1 Tax=Actinoallomurus acaciae TaxID=502577 RepID=A0ABV5YFT1_9ACTN
MGVARWRGVPLSAVLERAGLTKRAVDVMPRGLDPDHVDAGTNHGRVRRPIPIARALDDAPLAYEMNGRPLPPDHGFPVRLVVP